MLESVTNIMRRDANIKIAVLPLCCLTFWTFWWCWWSKMKKEKKRKKDWKRGYLPLRDFDVFCFLFIIIYGPESTIAHKYSGCFVGFSSLICGDKILRKSNLNESWCLSQLIFAWFKEMTFFTVSQTNRSYYTALNDDAIGFKCCWWFRVCQQRKVRKSSGESHIKHIKHYRWLTLN